MNASCETIWAAKVLEVENLTVRYGAFLAVDRVSLAVGEGVIVGLVGPNGAGKSSLVRVVSGLVRPAAGAVVRFREQPLDGIPPHGRVDRGIAVVPEGRGLFPQMSVEENLLMGRYRRGMGNGARALMDHAFTLFPILQERRRQLADTLSGGQQQMLAIATGIMSEPQLLILDEPSLGLAPIVVDEIGRTLRRLKGEGVTILLVEQNAKLAADIADEIYVMQTGRISHHGAASNLMTDRGVMESFLSVQ
jgi:branched-chain amino acid transport system ATP-binding protein